MEPESGEVAALSRAGQAGEVGSVFRCELATHLAVHGLRSRPISGLYLPHGVDPARLDFETSDPTDDIRVTFSDGRRAYVSAKRKIDKGRPLEETVTGWIGQVPTLGPDDLLVIAGEELVGPIKNLDRVLRRHRANLRMESRDEEKAFNLLVDLLPPNVRETVLDRARILHLPNSTAPASHRDLLAALMDFIVADLQGQRAVSTLADFFHRQAGEALGSSIDDWVVTLRNDSLTVFSDPGGPTSMRVASRLNAVGNYLARLKEDAGRIDLSLLAEDLPPIVADDIIGGLQIDIEGERTSHFLLQYLRRWRRMLIIGQPGSGKSVALREIAAHCATHPEAPTPLPVVLPRLLKQQPERLTIDGIIDGVTLNTVSSAERAPLAEYLTDELANGRAIILCDGLDECGSRAPWVAQQLAKILASVHPNCGFVLATRANAQIPAARLGLPRVELTCPRDLSETVDRILVECADARFSEPNRTVWLATRRAWIKDAKEHHEHLLTVPLLAILLALICANASDAELPKGRAALLHRAVEQSVARWEQLRGTLDPDRPWSPSLTTSMLIRGFVVLGRLLDGGATPTREQALESLSGMLRDPKQWDMSPAAATEVAEYVLRFWDEYVAVFVVNPAEELTTRSKVFAEIATAMWAKDCEPEELRGWLGKSLKYTDSDGAIALAAGLDPRMAEALLEVGGTSRPEATLMVADLAVRDIVTLSDSEMDWTLRELADGAVASLEGAPPAKRGPSSPPEQFPTLWDETRAAGPWPFVEAACLLALPPALRSQRANLIRSAELDDSAEAIAMALCELTDARTDDSPLTSSGIAALAKALAIPLPLESEMVQKGRRRFELVSGGHLKPGLDQVALAAAKYLSELADDQGERLFEIAKHAPGRIAEQIFAELAHAGFDTSRRWRNLTKRMRDWASNRRDDRAELLSDLMSLGGSHSESENENLWSLSDMGDLLTATGYSKSAASEIDRAFIHDTSEIRRAWLDAIADAYGIDKVAVAAQARHLQQAIEVESLLDEWLVAGTTPLVKPVLSPRLEERLTVDQRLTLLACLEADSSWIAWSAANVLANFDEGVPWDSQELFSKDMSRWPRPRAGLFYAIAILTAGDQRLPLLTQAACSDSADYRYAAGMVVSVASDLDFDGSVMQRLRRDVDLSVRPEGAHQDLPAPTHWSCNDCRAVNAIDVEDCPGCDDGVRPRP
ncbi:NACHT domain-containing protein [Streptomyces luteogriseus]|uniref:NACHT domain-containing protein n=1 Tax=Streptomyces luteogriseus TaxID=68233 RepID=UPI003797AADF